MIYGWISPLQRPIFPLFLAIALSACGGGGSESGGGFVPPSPAAPPEGATISVSLTNIDRQKITEINPVQQGVFSVSVSGPDGQPLAEKVVSATTTLGQLIPDNGTALTDEQGVAVLYVAAGSEDGAGTLTATATFNEVDSDGSVSFSISTSVPAATRKLGRINNSGQFVEGEIGIAPTGQISEGGTAALSLVVVDENLDLVSTPEAVTLTSNCLLGGRATLDPVSPVSFISTITMSYTATRCKGDDLITATLQSSGAEATGTLSIAALVGESIAFDEAKTASRVVGIRGTGSASGLTESTNVFFTVTDSGSQPIEGTRVNFSLQQSASDVALACDSVAYCVYDSAEDEAAGRSTQYTARSGADGSVSTTLLAGSTAGPIQVLAYIDTNDNGERESDEPSSVSKVLFVSTGVADQNSISLSAKLLNPYGSTLAGYKGGKLCSELGYDNASYLTGGLEADGLCTEVSVKLADKFNHPVPDGTVATFVSEYGRIMSSCATVNGDCVVAWSSQNPRSSATVTQYSAPITINENLNSSTPSRYNCPSHRADHGPCPDDIADPTVNPPGAPRGGRSTITVLVTGEESFIDKNSNGFYDEGEIWTNLTEAFTDHNEDGVYTPVQRNNCADPLIADDVCLAGFEESFFDLNGNGEFDLNDEPKSALNIPLPDGLYHGVLCREAEAAMGICSRELIQLWKSIEIILSPDEEGYEFLIVDRNKQKIGDAVFGGNSYQLFVSDLYNNPPPALSEITITGTGGCSAINGTATVPLPSSSKAGAYGITFGIATDIESDWPGLNGDRVEVRLTLPSGNSIYQTLRCPVYRKCAGEGGGFSPLNPEECGS
jgi:hypothetical protein